MGQKNPRWVKKMKCFKILFWTNFSPNLTYKTYIRLLVISKLDFFKFFPFHGEMVKGYKPP